MKNALRLLPVLALVGFGGITTAQAASTTSQTAVSLAPSSLSTYEDGYHDGEVFDNGHLSDQGAIDDEIAYAQSQMDYYASIYTQRDQYAYWMGYRDGLTQNRY